MNHWKRGLNFCRKNWPSSKTFSKLIQVWFSFVKKQRKMFIDLPILGSNNMTFAKPVVVTKSQPLVFNDEDNVPTIVFDLNG